VKKYATLPLTFVAVISRLPDDVSMDETRTIVKAMHGRMQRCFKPDAAGGLISTSEGATSGCDGKKRGMVEWYE
jgi:hypothetical protein